MVARTGFIGIVLLAVGCGCLTGCTQTHGGFDPLAGREASAGRENATPRADHEPGPIEPEQAPAPAGTSAEPAHEFAAVSFPLELIANDPLEFLRIMARRCATLTQYRVLLIREERRGLFRRLHPPERIDAWFRRDPFSVKFVWLDPEIKFGESTFVAGQQDNKVRFSPRRPVLGLRPGVVRVSVGAPAFWGEARHPVTDFGLENLLLRTLEVIAASEQGYEVAYRGRTQVGDPPRAAHEIYVNVPQSDGEPPIQHMYFDELSGLPLGTRVLNADGALEAVYLYLDLDASVELTDEDFLLTQEQAGS